MPIYEDRTMDVRTSAGIERRRIDHMDMSCEGAMSNRYMARVQRYVPELRDGERVEWLCGDDIPLIVEVPHHA